MLISMKLSVLSQPVNLLKLLLFLFACLFSVLLFVCLFFCTDITFMGENSADEIKKKKKKKKRKEKRSV